MQSQEGIWCCAASENYSRPAACAGCAVCGSIAVVGRGAQNATGESHKKKAHRVLKYIVSWFGSAWDKDTRHGTIGHATGAAVNIKRH